MAALLQRARRRLTAEADGWLVVLAFGVWYLSNLGGALSIDEAIYAESGFGVFAGNPYLNPTHAIAPTAKYTSGLSQVLFGHSSTAVRLPAALFGLATLYVTYRLGRRLAGRWLGLVAMVLVGSTYFFAHYAVRMMLDVPLAFFLAASLLAVTAYRDRASRRVGLLAGVLLAALATTKIYGPIYALAPTALLVWSALRRSGGRETLQRLQAPLVGGLGLLVVVYVPFAVFPHPTVAGSYAAAFETVLSIPILGNYAYVAGQAVAKNFLHLGGGHAVVVGDTVYQRPPFWSYLYWFFERGGLLYLGSLLALAVAVPVAVVRRDRDLVALAWVVAVPLVVLSLLTVKFPRYVLPLYPLVILGGLYGVAVLLRVALDRVGTPHARRQVTVPAVVVGLVLVVALVPPSPIMASAETPIREDSGFDRVATAVDAAAADSPDALVVLTYHPSALDYYLGDRPDVTLVNIRPGDTTGDTHAALAARIEAGEIDLAVVPTDDPRLRGTALYRRVTAGTQLAAVETSPGDGRLLVYDVGSRSS